MDTLYSLQNNPQLILTDTQLIIPSDKKFTFVMNETQMEDMLNKLLYCKYNVSDEDLHIFRIRMMREKCISHDIGIEDFDDIIDEIKEEQTNQLRDDVGKDRKQHEKCDLCGSKYTNYDNHIKTKKHCKMVSKWEKMNDKLMI